MSDEERGNEFSIRAYIDDIFDLINDGVYISDRNGLTLKVNTMYERLTGLKRESLLGRHVKQLVEKGFDTILNPTIVKTGKPSTIIQVDKRGKKRLLLSGYPVFDDNKEVALVVTFVRDVTLMEQLREQIRIQRGLVEKYRTNVQYCYEDSESRSPLIAESKSMQALIKKIGNVSGTDATILLQGETGVGKDVFARKIHKTSLRSEKPFTKVDCPTIPESLLESELFGYSPGAFSGAHKSGKLGFFEMADKGTLFLDEIGELPLVMQSKLLRVLQDREIVRVGSTKTRKVDVRVISATNRNLEEEVQHGRFRSDLYYRLHVAVINIPPLRDRKEDILPLADFFLRRYTNRYKRNLYFERDTQRILETYDWPGNVRELQNLVQGLVISRQSGGIGIPDLPSNMVGRISDSCKEVPGTLSETFPEISQSIDFSDLYQELETGKRSLKSIMKDIEIQILNYSLQKHGSHAKVAERFKVDRSTLFRKLRSG